MAKGQAHDEELRSQIESRILAGSGVTELAAEFSLSHSVVSRWRKALGPKLDDLGREKKEKVDRLIVDYLSVNLIALSSQAKVATEEAYIRRFPPQQLAILHGVMADKAARIYEAFNGVSRREDTEATGSSEDSE